MGQNALGQALVGLILQQNRQKAQAQRDAQAAEIAREREQRQQLRQDARRFVAQGVDPTKLGAFSSLPSGEADVLREEAKLVRNQRKQFEAQTQLQGAQQALNDPRTLTAPGEQGINPQSLGLESVMALLRQQEGAQQQLGELQQQGLPPSLPVGGGQGQQGLGLDPQQAFLSPEARRQQAFAERRQLVAADLRAAEKEQLERREKLADAGRDAQVESIAVVMAEDPEQGVELLRSLGNSFPVGADIVQAQVLTRAHELRIEERMGPEPTEAIRTLEARANFWGKELLAHDTNGDPVRPNRREAFLLADKAAFIDPATGLVGLGTPAGKKATDASARSSLMLVYANMRAAADVLAELGGGTAISGPLETLSGRLGVEGDAAVARFQAAQAHFQTLLQKARSGAVLNETEIEILGRALAQVSQIRMVDGQLSPVSMARFRDLERTLANEHLGIFSPKRRKLAGRLVKQSIDEYVTDFRQQMLAEGGGTQSQLDALQAVVDNFPGGE